MNTPPKRKGKSFWSRVEQAGETMEMYIRLFLGFLFAFLFSGIAWGIGNYVWVGLAVICVLVAFPIGFLVGFFWLEVKFILRLIFRLIVGL
jgi:hypothetical protein